MSRPRWTIVILERGRAARSFDLSHRTLKLGLTAPLLAIAAGLLAGVIMGSDGAQVASAAAPTGPRTSALDSEAVEDHEHEEGREHEEGDEPAIVERAPAPAVAPADGDAVPELVTRGQIPPDDHPRVLRLRALADNDTIETRIFDAEGEPRPAAFEALSYVLRSRATGARVPVEPRLARVLLRISARYRDRYLRLVSGYREAGHGTSAHSYHTRGMAADIRVSGVEAEELFAVATEVGAFGVGLYPEDGFVHVDVRMQPHRWEQSAEGENVALPHPPRWRMIRRFGEFLRL